MLISLPNSALSLHCLVAMTALSTSVVTYYFKDKYFRNDLLRALEKI